MSQRAANPADADNMPRVDERTRRPFTHPVGSLSVPEIPGYHLHWFRGDAQRIQRAFEAGYEFVDPNEVHVNEKRLGADTAEDGNTDMGTRISVSAGGDMGQDGQPVRLYLMKTRQEWWEKDQAALTAPGSRLEGVRQSLASGMLGAEKQSSEDKAQVYVDPKRTKLPDFLRKKA